MTDVLTPLSYDDQDHNDHYDHHDDGIGMIHDIDFDGDDDHHQHNDYCPLSVPIRSSSSMASVVSNTTADDALTFVDDIPLNKKPRRKWTSINLSLGICSLIMLMAAFYSVNVWRTTVTHTNSRYEVKQSQHQLLSQTLQVQLESVVQTLVSKQESAKQTERDTARVVARADQLSLQMDQTTTTWSQQVHDTYYNLALDKFGAGPHHVEFALDVWNGQDAPTRRTFVAKLAPLHLMPASVYLFLQQVSYGLWDNTMLPLNLPHVLVAEPYNPQLSGHDQEQVFAKMQRLGLARAPMAEYSPDFPNDAYTLAFGNEQLPGARFFINKIDNTERNQGDNNMPAFAKIVMGRNVIDDLGQSQPQAGAKSGYMQPVDIVSVRHVKGLKIVEGGIEYLEN